jgi:hypothetical protein
MVKKAILALSFMICSCQSWQPTEIYEFVPDECVWYDGNSSIEYKCDDEILRSRFMMIRIDEYIYFKTNYKCVLRESKD